MSFERASLIFWTIVIGFGIALAACTLSGCTFKSTEDDHFKDGTLVETQKVSEIDVTDVGLLKEAEQWLHP